MEYRFEPKLWKFKYRIHFCLIEFSARLNCWWHPDIYDFWKTQRFHNFEKINRILHQISPRLPRDSPLYDPWRRGKTWNTDLNRNHEISNTNFLFVFHELRHYTVCEKRVSLETRCFQKNKKLKHRKSDSPTNFS